MAWVKITEKEHVLPRLNDHEREAYDDAGDRYLRNKLPKIIAQVVARVRGAVNSCHDNTSFGPDGTVPEESIYHAVSLIRTALVGSNPNTNDLQGDEREREYTEAVAYLQRVASCEEVIAPAEAEVGASTSAGIEWGSDPKLNFTY